MPTLSSPRSPSHATDGCWNQTRKEKCKTWFCHKILRQEIYILWVLYTFVIYKIGVNHMSFLYHQLWQDNMSNETCSCSSYLCWYNLSWLHLCLPATHYLLSYTFSLSCGCIPLVVSVPPRGVVWLIPWPRIFLLVFFYPISTLLLAPAC